MPEKRAAVSGGGIQAAASIRNAASVTFRTGVAAACVRDRSGFPLCPSNPALRKTGVRMPLSSGQPIDATSVSFADLRIAGIPLARIPLARIRIVPLRAAYLRSPARFLNPRTYTTDEFLFDARFPLSPFCQHPGAASPCARPVRDIRHGADGCFRHGRRSKHG